MLVDDDDQDGVVADLEKLEQRLKAEKVPMNAVCRRAKVDHSAVVRWRKKELDPRMGAWRRLHRAADELIAERRKMVAAEAEARAAEAAEAARRARVAAGLSPS